MIIIPLIKHHWDYLPNGEENRCVAVTRKGAQCKNPVFTGQEHSPIDRRTCLISQEAFDRMEAALCRVHA